MTNRGERQFRVNEQCIVGLPACGYGFESSRMCFLARPADAEFQLEHDILAQLLKERNYELYAALQSIEPGTFAFCTKICSKIITSHFCIVLLNHSRHALHKDVLIANPNVHLEYGMALSFHKHVIPMQREDEVLPFNIYPLDTVKYRPDTFRTKAEAAIDDAILRYTTKEPPGRPVGAASDVLKYFGFRGLRYSDVTSDDTGAIYRLGASYGFNLFDGPDGVVFFGYFHEMDPVDVIVNTRFLINNIRSAVERVRNPVITIGLSDEQRRFAIELLEGLSITLLVSEDAPVDEIADRIREARDPGPAFPLEVIRPSDMATQIRDEYEKIALTSIGSIKR